MILHPFSFLNYNKIKKIIQKSNFLFFIWTPVKTYNSFFNTDKFMFCSLKVYFFNSFFSFYYKNLKLLKNFCNLIYSYKKYSLSSMISFLESKFLFGVYKNFFFFFSKKQLQNNSYFYFNKLNFFFLKSLYTINQI